MSLDMKSKSVAFSMFIFLLARDTLSAETQTPGENNELERRLGGAEDAMVLDMLNVFKRLMGD